MTYRRFALLMTGVVLAALLVAGTIGYVLGRSARPGPTQALNETPGSAYALARAESLASGLRQGVSEGLIQARRVSRREGSRQGRKAGMRYVATAKAPHQASSGESEAPSALAGSGGVLVVGDSLEVLTSPYLKKYLPGIQLTVNAIGGYNSLQIFDLFQQSYDPSQSVIVFDAGTNDNPAYPEILAGRLNSVATAIGNRCMVVPTINGLTVNGINSDGKNEVVRRFARSRPGTQTPDWAGFVASHPELMQSDGLHPIPEGADQRAQLIAGGVLNCLAQGGAPVSGG
jgi:hypothetical protein